MKTLGFTRRTPLDVSAEDLFRWHVRPGAFQRLSPPWERVQVLAPGAGVSDGSRVVLRVRLAPLVWKRWVAEHRDVVPGRGFRDVQVEGPFRLWEHAHAFEPRGAGSSTLVDDVRYALPLGPLGRLFGGRATRRKLERMFAYRHRVTAGDLARHHAGGGHAAPLRVLVTGASGLVGTALGAFLTTGGHEVVPLARATAARTDAPTWDPAAGRIDLAPAGDVDAVVHLAGESIAGGRWTERRKERLRSSRIDATRLLVSALSGLARPPRVLVSASGVGIYGDRGEEVLTEESAPGDDFLSGLAAAWEAEARAAEAAGIRVACLRFGMVLTPAGGALASMLPAFRAGVAGRLGSGRQYVPWVSLDDVLGAVLHALVEERVSGPVNVVGPELVTNREFTRTLGRVLRRPTFLPAPRFALRLALGELADALLLASQRAEPERLRASGFTWQHPTLESALRHVLGRTG